MILHWLQSKWKLALTAALLLALVTAGGLALFYRQYQNPQRFVRRADQYAAQGQMQAANDQYRRALRFTKTDTARIAIFEAMINNNQEMNAAPPTEIFDESRALIGLYASVFRLTGNKNEEAASRLLNASFTMAQALNSTSQWQQLQDTCKLVLRLDENNETARKYQLITKVLLPKKQPTERDYADLLAEFRAFREADLTDGDLAYYEALTLVNHAIMIDQEYLQKRRHDRLRQALAIMNTYINSNPEELLPRVRRLQLIGRCLILAPVPEDLADLKELSESLWEKFAADIPAPDRQAGLELGKTFFTLAQLAAQRAAREKPELLQGLTVAPYRERAEQLLEKVGGDKTDIIALDAWLTLAQMRRFEQNLAGTLQALDKLLDAQITFAPGVEAMIAWHRQLQTRFLRMDIWLEQYETLKNETILKQVTEEVVQLKEKVGQENPYVRIIEARIAYLQGHYWVVLRKLRQAEEIYGQEIPQSIYLAGLSLSQLGETGAASRLLVQYLASRAGDARSRAKALLALSRDMLKLREFGQAEKIARRMVAEDPDNAEATVALAQALLMQATAGAPLRSEQERKQDVEDVKTLLQPWVEKGLPEAVALAAQARQVEGDAEAARHLLTTHCSRFPEDMRSLQALYSTLISQDQTEAARQWLRRGLAKVPESMAAKLLEQAVEGDPQWMPYGAQLLAVAAAEDPVERELTTWQLLSSLQQHELAKQARERVAQLDQQHTRVQEFLWSEAVANRNWIAAEKIAEDAVVQPGLEFQAELWRAQLAITNQDLNAAVSQLQRLTTYYPASSAAFAMLGSVYRMKDDLRKAQEYLERAIEIRPDNQYATKQLINVNIARGFNYQAMKYMRQALRFAPHDENLIRMFLHYLENYESPDQALKLRQQLALMKPDDSRNQLEVARLLLRTRQFEQAETLLRELMAQYPDDFEPVLIMSQYYAVTDAVQTGVHLLQAYLAEHPEQADTIAWTRFAEFLEQTGADEQKVLDILNQAMAMTGDTAVPKRYLGTWYMRHGKPRQAATVFNELYAQTNSPELLLRSVEASLANNQVENAEKTFDNYLKTEALTGEAGILLARIQIVREKIPEAYATLSRVIDNTPGHLDAYLLRAQLVWQNSKLSDDHTLVEKDLQKVLEVNPRAASARLLLAQRLSAAGRNEEAVVHLKQLLAQDGGNVDYYVMLARLYLADGEFNRLAQLIQDWDKVATAPPVKPLVTLWRARLARATGDIPQAVEQFAQAYRDLAGDLTVFHEYLLVLLRDRQYDKINTEFQNAHPTLQQSPQVLMTVAQATAATGKHSDAVLAFVEAFANSNDNAILQYQILATAQQLLTEAPWRDLIKLTAPLDKTRVTYLYSALNEARAGNSDKAIGMLEKLRSEITPENPIYIRTMISLANVAIQVDDHERAERILTLALAVAPNDPTILNNLAYEVATLGKQPFRAVELAEKALANLTDESVENRANILDTLGYAQYLAGLSAYAETTLKRSLRLAEIPVTYMHLGQVYLAQGRPGSAIEVLEKIQEQVMASGEKKIIAKVEELLADARAQVERQAQN